MFADGSHYDSRSLAAGFFCQQPAHDCSVLVIQMADGFVQEDKVERLAKAADKSDPLLLPERKHASLFVDFIGNTDCFEESDNLFFLFIIVQAIL